MVELTGMMIPDARRAAVMALAAFALIWAGWGVTRQPSAATSSPSWSPAASSPLARREHPRLLVTRSILAELRHRLSTSFREEFQAFVTMTNRLLERGTASRDVAENLMNIAFLYAVGQVPGIDYGGRSPDHYRDHALSLFRGAVDEERSGHHMALAYDWLFRDLTHEERRRAVASLKARQYQGSGNPLNGNDITSRARLVMAGLAFWGDGIDDAAAEEMASAYGRLLDNADQGVLDAGSFISGSDGGWGQGLSYSVNASVMMLLLQALESWRTSNGLTREEVFAAPNTRVLRYYPQWVAYHVLPHPLEARRSGERPRFIAYRTHHMDSGVALDGWADLPSNLSALRAYREIDPAAAGLAQWLIEERVGPLDADSPKGQDHAIAAHFILGDKGVVPRSPQELGLPLTKRFGGLGWTVMRTSWDDLSASMITITAAPWSREAGTYSNRDQGTFTIQRRGPLVINSGAAIHHSYSNSTWSGNTLLFVDPGEQVDEATYPDRGGQRRLFPLLTSLAQLSPASAHDIGGIKRFVAASPTDGWDADYAFADVTRAYNGPQNQDGRNRERVRTFTRQFVYFRPASSGESDRLVVFDRAESVDARLEKRWLLHTSAEPRIGGLESVERPGKWIYAGAREITVTNTQAGSNGRLFVTSLLPAVKEIVKIGGPGHEFEDPFGVNADEDYHPDKAQYVGQYRVEVIPRERREQDVFLHVLEATDADRPSPTEVELLSERRAVAVRIGDRIAVFNESEAPFDEAEFEVTNPGSYRLLVGDLAPGSGYSLEFAGGRADIMAGEAGAAYLSLSVSQGNARLRLRRN